MFDLTDSLLPKRRGREPLRVLSVGFDGDGLEEMRSLLQTLQVKVQSEINVPLRQITPGTYIGKGKLDEISQLIQEQPVDGVVFDAELSPQQLRNLEKTLGKPTLDRSGVIIEIFSSHARTKEAKTQVELAKVQYLLPRLTHFWTHFERQRGGIGQKGMGEKQLEVDRRLLKKRIALLQKRLKEIEKERQVQRSGRVDLLKVALVGYTNAGKSTLLNGLTQSQVLAEDKLFATLDSSVRALDPHSHPPLVAIDTVGFIDKIPPSLIASFRSTLEELYQADLLLHVVDASSPRAREQFLVTEKILEEMDLKNKPRMTVLNKIDQVRNASDLNWTRLIAPGSPRVSALSQSDLVKLRDLIIEHFKSTLDVWEVVIPYPESKLDALVHAYASIEKKKFLEQGVFYRLRISPSIAGKLELDKYRT